MILSISLCSRGDRKIYHNLRETLMGCKRTNRNMHFERKWMPASDGHRQKIVGWWNEDLKLCARARAHNDNEFATNKPSLKHSHPRKWSDKLRRDITSMADLIKNQNEAISPKPSADAWCWQWWAHWVNQSKYKKTNFQLVITLRPVER